MPAPTTVGVVLLLHMMPANRKSWQGFQDRLVKEGLASLAIDLRGHGESVRGPEGRTLDFRSFADSEHRAALFDVIGGCEWLSHRGFTPAQTIVCGASIGANLALQMLLENPSLKGVALLSPGGDYHGLNAREDVRGVLPHQALWMAASEGDDQESFETSKILFEAASSKTKRFLPLKTAGHGTAMLQSHPDLMDGLSEWIKETIAWIP